MPAGMIHLIALVAIIGIPLTIIEAVLKQQFAQQFAAKDTPLHRTHDKLVRELASSDEAAAADESAHPLQVSDVAVRHQMFAARYKKLFPAGENSITMDSCREYNQGERARFQRQVKHLLADLLDARLSQDAQHWRSNAETT